jgi:hypothetical protein
MRLDPHHTGLRETVLLRLTLSGADFLSHSGAEMQPSPGKKPRRSILLDAKNERVVSKVDRASGDPLLARSDRARQLLAKLNAIGNMRLDA